MEITFNSTAIIHTFPNINPICTVEGGIRDGHYTDRSGFTNTTVPLTQVEGAKTLYLVCFRRTVGEREYVRLLGTIGKQPCHNAPQYMLGLMVALTEEEMPEQLLRDKNIIAAEPSNGLSIFIGELGDRNFLCVSRFGGRRELHLAHLRSSWNDFWVFLAEDLAP